MKAIVLAAGLSRRMKSQKLLLPLGGDTVIGATLTAVTRASFDEVVLVASDAVADAVTAYRDKYANLRVAINKHPEEGQSSSLRLGISALGEPCDFCVALGDMPLVSSEQIERYKKFFDNLDGKYTALVPKRGDATGHPAFFRRAWTGRFSSLTGDSGGRQAIREFSEEVAWTEGEDSFFRDVDTPGDYRDILHKIGY